MHKMSCFEKGQLSLSHFSERSSKKQNKNSENSENPEITPSTKFITEGIYKTYFEHKCITVHKIHKVARKRSGMKKEI